MLQQPRSGWPGAIANCEISAGGLDAAGCHGVISEEMVPGPGLEPGYSAPKADVLPIRRSRKRSQKFSRGEQRCKPSGGGKFGAGWGAVRSRAVSAKLMKVVRTNNGEVSERFKEHAWKACVGEILPWVRIPPSPPYLQKAANSRHVRQSILLRCVGGDGMLRRLFSGHGLN